jgi:DNA-binding PadR family transcriptional regulator
MTKLSVLLIFAQAGTFLAPEHVCRKLQPRPDLRSLYSYLARLRGQGLLERGPDRSRGHLSYRITEKGHKRIAFFRTQIRPSGRAR